MVREAIYQYTKKEMEIEFEPEGHSNFSISLRMVKSTMKSGKQHNIYKSSG
jgi:hypothetical protein